MNWEFISEANLQLTETEQQYYTYIFLYCRDPSDDDRVPVVKAAKLLRSANLPRDVTVKVTTLIIIIKLFRSYFLPHYCVRLD